MSDILLVSLGSTAGLRAADAELAGSLRRAGADVTQVEVELPAERRGFVLHDLAQARAARRAAARALAESRPRANGPRFP